MLIHYMWNQISQHTYGLLPEINIECGNSHMETLICMMFWSQDLAVCPHIKVVQENRKRSKVLTLNLQREKHIFCKRICEHSARLVVFCIMSIASHIPRVYVYRDHIDGLVQDCSNSRALAMEVFRRFVLICCVLRNHVSGRTLNIHIQIWNTLKHLPYLLNDTRGHHVPQIHMPIYKAVLCRLVVWRVPSNFNFCPYMYITRPAPSQGLTHLIPQKET